MSSIVIAVPAMYADHHVVEVRRILQEVPGVRDVYASSAFGVIEIDFDPGQTSAGDLERRLDEAGYLSELPAPIESGEPATDRTAAEGRYRRHAANNAPSGSTVAFRQEMRPAAPTREDAIETTEE